jgi:dinuclear metal center YbgI/SA1388 family protein
VPTVREVVAALQVRYRPEWAESWDAVGLVCGDPDARVERLLLAVDPAPVVVEEALAWGADLVLTHHPLLLRGVHSVAAVTPKGSLVHRLVREGVALLTAHTNADVARPGVSDALAEALGVVDARPLAPLPDARDKVVTFVPAADADRVLDALAAAGAGRIGAYERCAYTLGGTGTFRAMPGANPVVGSVGKVEAVAETRLEMVLPRSAREAVVAALRASHPYEEPAFDVYELAALPTDLGLGRIGTLPEPETLEDLLVRVADGLPATVGGVRAAGDPERVVQCVAVCGGSGDSLLDAARAAGADAYVTADLRHHRALEAMEAGGPALVDVPHWASEWPWLGQAAALLAADLADGDGPPLKVRVSTTSTDPWTLHAETVPPIDPEDL